MAAGGYLRDHHKELFHDAKLNQHFNHAMFHGYDFDNTMLRIGSMNMMLHGVDNPAILHRDSLGQEHRAPSDILAELGKLEGEIAMGMKALEVLLERQVGA